MSLLVFDDVFPMEMRSPVQKIFSGKSKPCLDFLEACVLVTWSNKNGFRELAKH